MARKKKVETSFEPSFDESIAADASEIGKSSNELPANQISDSGTSENKSLIQRMIQDFNIFDAFLLISLICISAATLKVFLAMAQYGGYFWDKPWQVTQ